MAGFKKLSTRQNRVMNCLLEGFTVIKACTETGIPERTVRRWVSEPAFKAELTRREGEVILAVSLRLVGMTNQALDTLEQALNDTNATIGTRLKASTTILEMVLKWRETVDFEERISELERTVNNDNKTKTT